tara:strand:+ start:4978 stop:5154 length:177 start_codon:yes stop_codon:yes gene_type:complete
MKNNELEKKIEVLEKKIGKLFYELINIKKTRLKEHELAIILDKLNELEIKINIIGGNH